METTGLYIPGKRSSRGFIVLVNLITYILGHDEFSWLLEIACSDLRTDGGYLYNTLSFTVDGDHLYACQLAKRVRKKFGSKEALLNGEKCYALADYLRPVVISRAVLDFPDIDYHILRRVEEVLSEFSAHDTATTLAPRTS